MNIKKWISNIITGLLAILLITVLGFAVTSKLSGGAPKIAGYELMTVLSGSMEPGIHTGSIIAVKPATDKTKFKVGDVITFQSIDEKNMLITHRVAEVKGSGSQVQYITKGDNNDAKDPKPIPAENVIAQYADVTIPYIGYMLNFAKSKTGLISLMIVPGALLIIWQMVSLWLIISRLEQKKEGKDTDVTSETLQNV